MHGIEAYDDDDGQLIFPTIGWKTSWVKGKTQNVLEGCYAIM